MKSEREIISDINKLIIYRDTLLQGSPEYITICEEIDVLVLRSIFYMEVE